MSESIYHTYHCAGHGSPCTLCGVTGVMTHPTLGVGRYSIKEGSDDPDQQVAETIAVMRDYANEDRYDRALTEDVQRAYRSENALEDTFHYLRRNGTRGMQFVRDETTGAPFESNQPGGWRPVVETL